MTTFRPLQVSDINCMAMLMQEFYAIDNYPIEIDISKKLLEEFISNKRLKKRHICTTFIKMNKGITQVVLNCISE